MKKLYLIAVLVYISFFSLNAQVTVTINPVQDNTIYQNYPNNSNGQGANIFAGTNVSSSPRRALLKFDIAASLPAGVTINAVTLTLNCNRAPQTTNYSLTLNKLLQNWGEGSSNAGTSNDGDGIAAAVNDATWPCSFSNGAGGCATSWSTAGGVYSATISATTLVGAPGIDYEWSTAQMRADVEAWLASPATNYGWILRSNELSGGTVKRFASGESSTLEERPRLSITYTPVIPVTLSHFKGQPSKYGSLLLWETAQEINNAFFILEHSIDATQFTAVKTIPGAINSSTRRSYQYIHTGVVEGSNYYRLAQTDLDGRKTYSPVVVVNHEKAITTLLIQPNPVSDKIRLDVPISPGKSAYVIYDMKGRVLSRAPLPANQVIPIYPSWPPGLYNLRITRANGMVMSANFLKE